MSIIIYTSVPIFIQIIPIYNPNYPYITNNFSKLETWPSCKFANWELMSNWVRKFQAIKFNSWFAINFSGYSKQYVICPCWLKPTIGTIKYPWQRSLSGLMKANQLLSIINVWFNIFNVVRAMRTTVRILLFQCIDEHMHCFPQ